MRRPWRIPDPRSAATLLLLAAAGTAAAQANSAEKVVGGPYVVNAGTRSADIMWLVQTGESSIGVEPGKPQKVEPILQARRIPFTGLKPSTVYHYQSFPGDAGKGSFKTAPEGAAAFQFVVYGDTRTRDDVHRSVVNAMLKQTSPDFVLHTGDLVAVGSDNSLWPIFFDIERDLLRKTAFFAAIGNHERNASNYYDLLNVHPYYSFDWGNAHFSVINSDIENAAATQAERDAFWSKQTRWLEDDLRNAQGAQFRFVAAHQPPITAVRRRQGDNPQMTALEPMFEKYHVTAGFFGHDHNYQHYLKNGVHYVTTGGGGAPLYDVDLPPAGITKKVASVENFVVVQVNGGSARLEAKTPDGQRLDAAELTGFSAAPSR